jgi:hypothetical protein
MTIERGKIENPQEPAIRITSLIFLALILASLTASNFGINATVIAALAVPWLSGTSIAFLIFYFTGRQQILRIQALTGKESLAHWECSSTLWNRFVSAQQRVNKKTLLFLPLIPCVFLIVLGFALEWFTTTDLSWKVFAWIAFFGWVTGVLIMGPLYWKEKSRYRYSHDSDVYIFIGSGGIYQGGKYYALNENLAQIKKVEILTGGEDPEVMEFCIDWSTICPHGGDIVRVPIPPEKRKEAEELLNKLALQS